MVSRALLVITLLVGISGAASANTIWSLSGVHFSDGGVATGSFTFNTAFTSLVAWDITVSGSGVGANYHYVSGTGLSNQFSPSANGVILASNPFVQEVILKFSSPLTNAGGTVNLITGNNTIDCNNGPCGTLQAGVVTTNPTPEPGSMPMTLSGASLVAAALFLRKHKQQKISR